MPDNLITEKKLIYSVKNYPTKGRWSKLLGASLFSQLDAAQFIPSLCIYSIVSTVSAVPRPFSSTKKTASRFAAPWINSLHTLNLNEFTNAPRRVRLLGYIGEGSAYRCQYANSRPRGKPLKYTTLCICIHIEAPSSFFTSHLCDATRPRVAENCTNTIPFSFINGLNI